MKYIEINRISIISHKNNSISFSDGKDEYLFNISKSTLFKKFHIKPIDKIDVKILDNPFDILKKIIKP